MNHLSPNAQYNLARSSSLPVRIAARARRRMYEQFLRRAIPLEMDTILDVGVTSDESYEASNYLELWYPHKNRITAVGLDEDSTLPVRFPGLKYQRADGCDLPFPDGSFDIVHSSAVIEHVGNDLKQQQFLTELVRVARRAVFVTTPNRWFPVEFHSLLPVLHWLPPDAFRSMLRGTRYDFFSHVENLNLLDRAKLRDCCASFTQNMVVIESIKLLGWPSNLLLTICK